jgi:CheY-like chemotaxis protein
MDMDMDMDMAEVEILLVEDNPSDAELCIRALKKNNLANKLVWVKDGAEALDLIFSEGNYTNSNNIIT